MGTVEGAPRFEMRGGLACLDFVNTVGWRMTGCPKEFLGSYANLLAWGSQAGVLGAAEAWRLSERAARAPEEARAVLSRATSLREAVYGAVSAAIAGDLPDQGDLAGINRELSVSLGRLRIAFADGSYGWGWDDGGEAGLDRPLWPVARSAAELLTSPALGRVRACAGEGCGWLFLDESRNRSRRWCDSRDCGNRERVRRHLARKTGKAPLARPKRSL